MKDSIFEFIVALSLFVYTTLICVQYFAQHIQPYNFSIFLVIVGYGTLIMFKLNQILEKNDKEKNK